MKSLKQTIIEMIEPNLNENGFYGSFPVYYKKSDDFLEIIELVKSKYEPSYKVGASIVYLKNPNENNNINYYTFQYTNGDLSKITPWECKEIYVLKGDKDELFFMNDLYLAWGLGLVCAPLTGKKPCGIKIKKRSTIEGCQKIIKHIPKLYKWLNQKKRAYDKAIITETIKHYDSLIVDGDDPVKDPPVLKEYMDKWDGQSFIDELDLDETKTVLEIGVGTGRLAIKIAPSSKSLFCVDISPKTVVRARENLKQFKNVQIICADFLEFEFKRNFDVIYSSLTFLHIKEKEKAINKIIDHLNINGRAIISLDKNQQDYIEYNAKKIRTYPDTPENIILLLKNEGISDIKITETEFAFIVTAIKA